MLAGFGAFDCVEALIDHHLLGVHHVNETGSESACVYSDLGFLVWGGPCSSVAGSRSCPARPTCDGSDELPAQYIRTTGAVALTWCGFAILIAGATKLVWSQLVFGYEPKLEDLLSLRCFTF